ncbi:MAG: alanine--tRNA ligase [Desulfovibrionaceae bacterium]|nr:alanine--tRNA ligase [Desulfovibrionaceae bacterium]
MLTAQEIRQRYLKFFERHQHEIVTSGPLIPPNDKTLLFTNAGMVQFKQLFLGAEKRSYSRASTCQKCLRVSGKHNDLENVGRTARHHTFFEMLGNFSFGDYFKREAITFAWEFVTKDLELPAEKLWVTIFREDEEAFNLWQEIAHLPKERIVRMGEKDNFWTMGDTGPCGPCSEIYIDQGADMACGDNCGIGQCDCDRFLEIWNLVFTQFDQAADGTRSLLAAPNIDTGMGLERIAAVCQGKRSNFDCDLFQDLIQYAANLAHVSYSFSDPDTNDVDTALRVIADHSRAAAFLIAEGVLPSNESRGYVLRRLIRRALRFATLMGVHEPFMYKVVGRVIKVMGEAYPELVAQEEFITRAVHDEEERFSQTLENGLRLLNVELEKLKEQGQQEIPGELCFLLYDTHGFPLDIVNDVAAKRGFSVDNAGFEAKMAEQRERARLNQKQGGLLGQAGEALDELLKRLATQGLASQFSGYEHLAEKTSISYLLDDLGAKVSMLGEGASGYMIAPKTPFYGESGGQVGDHGHLKSFSCEAEIVGTLKPVPTLLVHKVKILSGELHINDEIELEVADLARKAACRNHSCTHLLHAALRKVLGTHVHQMGSLVDEHRLRFDFSHPHALTDAEIKEVESYVNNAILADLPIETVEMDRESAEKSGAMALFEEKYGDVVRVVKMGLPHAEPVSMELCGGTHLTRTSQAGIFLILSESGVAAGTRRIEAVTGSNALEYIAAQRSYLAAAQGLLKAKPEQVAERITTLKEEVKKLRKAADKNDTAKIDGASLLKNCRDVSGVKLLTAEIPNATIKTLRSLMDDLRSRLATASVICLAGQDAGKVGLLLYVSKDLHGRFTAPSLIGPIAAEVGGSGGGRPDLAQAGGTNPAGLAKALAKVAELLG